MSKILNLWLIYVNVVQCQSNWFALDAIAQVDADIEIPDG